MKNQPDGNKKDGTEIAESVGTEIAEPVGTDSALFNFELPPVSEQSNDFIHDDPEPDDNEPEHVHGFEEISEAEKHRGALDDKGQPYDPLIHAYPPEKTGKLQKWKKKPKKDVEQAAVNDVKSNASYRGEAQKFATLYGESHRLLFGKGGYVVKDELIPLVDSLERYMLENGHTQISAGWDVLLSSGMYSFAVTQRETNKEKVNKWFSGLYNSIKSMFGFKTKEKKDNAQSDSRDNVQR